MRECGHAPRNKANTQPAGPVRTAEPECRLEDLFHCIAHDKQEPPLAGAASAATGKGSRRVA